MKMKVYVQASGCEREVRCLMGTDLVTRGEDSVTELAVRLTLIFHHPTHILVDSKLTLIK